MVPDLSHLRMMSFTLDLPLSVAGQVKKHAHVEVVFTNHCYSRELLLDEVVSADLKVLDGVRERVFCQERYDYSLGLPDKITDLLSNNRQVFRTNKANFFNIYLCEVDENGKTLMIPYSIFMDANKRQDPGQPQKIVIHIQSAHLRRTKGQPKPVGPAICVQELLGEVWEHGRQLSRPIPKKGKKN